MKPFRLQSLLDYRKHSEDMIHKSLLHFIEEHDLLAQQKDKGQRELEKLYNSFQESKQKNILIPEIMLYENCIESKKYELKNIFQQIEALDQRIKQEQTKLVHARQERKTLEILKKNREKDEIEKNQHMEKVFSDEVAIQCFGDRK